MVGNVAKMSVGRRYAPVSYFGSLDLNVEIRLRLPVSICVSVQAVIFAERVVLLDVMAVWEKVRKYCFVVFHCGKLTWITDLSASGVFEDSGLLYAFAILFQSKYKVTAS